jgi:hypothetical protein
MRHGRQGSLMGEAVAGITVACTYEKGGPGIPEPPSNLVTRKGD